MMKKKQVIQSAAVLLFTAGLSAGALSGTYAFGRTSYHIAVNGTEMGAVFSRAEAEKIIRDGRLRAMKNGTGYVYTDADITVTEGKEFFLKSSRRKKLTEKLAKAVAQETPWEKAEAYTVTAGGYSADFTSQEEALSFLEQVKDHSEGCEDFEVVFELATGQKGTRKAQIISKEQADKKEQESDQYGVSGMLSDIYGEAVRQGTGEYEDQTGMLSAAFADNVYGYENLVDASDLADAAAEAEEVTKEKESNTIYVVEAGDCLSTIAEKYDTTVDSIVALNELSGADATVYLDQELTVAVPKPDISLRLTEGIVYEESFSVEPTIIYQDSWYTNQQNVLQEGSDGVRRINAAITTENGQEVERKTLHTAVLAEAQPAVIEQGTQIPPTYQKPVSGGRYTSGFGKRWGRMHKGVDWAVPIGTPVYASCGGTVSVAGAARGYGYAVYINHSDGRQTRYGHLSKVLVSPGQTVEQGQKIALSGNTGRSTGPHVHFEILINGTQVNPLNYMN